MRRARKKKPGASYHIFSRAVRGEKIFDLPGARKMFMKVIRRAKKKFKFEMYNFCIMGSHYHFIMKPLGDEDISKIMQWIKSVFARKFNKAFGYFGHVFAERFKSVIIHSFKQYLDTFIYVALNPVKAQLAESATDYEYSGLTFLQKGILDILERPPTEFLHVVWKEIIMSGEEVPG